MKSFSQIPYQDLPNNSEPASSVIITELWESLKEYLNNTAYGTQQN